MIITTTAAERTPLIQVTVEEQLLVLRLLELLSLFTLFSLLLIPREARVILTSLFWPHCRLASPCSWFIWQPFPSPEPESTRPEASAPPLFTTVKNPGMTTGSFGSVRSSEL